MDPIYPSKLSAGDEVRVISPARSLAIIDAKKREIAARRFESLGLKLTFGKHVEKSDDFSSTTIENRIEDLHEAFSDPGVKAIISVIGGFNSNQLLPYIDWSLLKNNPKIFCGFSDITALGNAIYAMTGLVTYSGVHYSSFGMEKHFDYSLEYFKKCLMQEDPYEVQPSQRWAKWFNDQEPKDNPGWLVLNQGAAQGTIIGGNLCTLNLLQGTKYMPSLTNTIVFIEDDAESLPHTFDRDLVSLIQQPGFNKVQGLVIGRFQEESRMTNELLRKIIRAKKELADLPIIANVDFGHTSPIVTFPIGGQTVIKAGQISSSIIITQH